MTEVFHRFFGSDPDAELVIGTHLFPPVLFGELRGSPPDQDFATEVIRTVEVDSFEFLVTRMGGMFVRPPGDLVGMEIGQAIKPRLDFETNAAAALNLFICELNTRGEVLSEPTSSLHMSRGELIADHAVITSGGGGSVVFHERTLGPTLALHEPVGLVMLPTRPEAVLDGALPLANSLALKSISTSLPELVAATYFLWSRRQLGEALIDGWVVCEQILGHIWKQQYVAAALDGGHRNRLRDHRTFTAAVQAEVLYARGVLPESLYRVVQEARGSRNDMAHGASVTVESANSGIVAMKAMLDHVLPQPVAEPELAQWLNW
jgi:hypothetical protein